jgi:hypothetical protein
MPELMKAMEVSSHTIPQLKWLLGLIRLSQPLDETDALQALNRALKWNPKLRRQGPSDSSSVIKVSEALQCLKGQVNTGSRTLDILQQGIRALYSTPHNALEGFADSVTQCLRENALRQDTPRARRRVTGHGRPARGHGYGRGKTGWRSGSGIVEIPSHLNVLR